MSLTTYRQLEQGSDAWLQARAGIVTASVVGQLISSTPRSGINYQCPECKASAGNPCVNLARLDKREIKALHSSRVAPPGAPPELTASDGETARTLTNHLVAERITGYVEDAYTSQDMLRGQLDEPLAREAYAEHFAPVQEVGFMVANEAFGKLGYSPDGLVGDDGLIEIKSRRQKKHLATILADEVPPENMAQLQAGLVVSERKWIDYISYCGGMPLYRKRVYPDPLWIDVICSAVELFELNAAKMIDLFHERTKDCPPTERVNHFEEIVIK